MNPLVCGAVGKARSFMEDLFGAAGVVRLADRLGKQIADLVGGRIALFKDQSNYVLFGQVVTFLPDYPSSDTYGNIIHPTHGAHTAS